MTTDTLDLPPIADPAPTVAPALPATIDLKRVDLHAVALAQFGDWRADVAAARKNLGTLALDLTIPARIAEAKSLRQRLINAPIADARATSKALKSKLAQVSKAVGAEEEAAVAAYSDAGTLITPKIEAAEQRIEDERLAREKAEEERIRNLELAVDAILDRWMDRCDAEGMTAARVALGMSALGEQPMPPELADVSAYWANRLTVTRAHMERRRLALAAEELAAEQAKVRAEAQRVAGIQARIAEIQAAATGHERANSVDLIEAALIVEALDVGEGIYQEFTGLAQAAKAATLATLRALTDAALAREAAEDAAADAEAARQAQQIPQPGAEAPASQEGVGENPLQPQPAVSTVDAGDVAAASVAVDEAVAPADDSTAPGVTQEFTEGQSDQQVLKAEGASPDATDRAASAATSPRGGAMGAGQPAAAGPADAVIGNPPFSTAADDGPLETSEADARPYVVPAVPVLDRGEPTMTLGALNEWLVPVQISGAGLELLGFPAAGRRKAAMLYHEGDKARIAAAIVTHLQGLAA